MKRWKEVRKKAEQQLQPRTLVELVGRSRLLVEHHRGILGYSPEEIVVGTEYGRLRITGAELQLGCMSREQLFIGGTIYGVTAEERDR